MEARRRSWSVALAACGALAAALLVFPGSPGGRTPSGRGDRSAPAGPSSPGPRAAPPFPPKADPGPEKGDAVEGPCSVGVRVRDWKGLPVEGAEVVFLRRPRDSLPDRMIHDPAFAPDPGPPLGRLRTDPDGRGRLYGIGAGTLRVRASAEGLCTVEDSVDLTVGAEMPRVDFRLLPARTLEGRVRFASGEPVPGARVLSGDISEGIVVAATDGEGRYRLDGLPPGLRGVSVVLGGRVSYDSGTLELPSVRRFDIVLPKGCALRFRVLDGEGGRPVEGAWVHAQVSGEDGASWSASVQGVTDGAGGAAFAGLPPGRVCQWSAVKEGAVAAKMEVNAAWPTLLPDRETVVDAVLPPGGRVRGIVRGEDGAPLPGAEAYAAPVSGDYADWFHGVSGRAGPDGSFVLAGLHPGPFTLGARERGFIEGEGIRVEVPSGGEVGQDIVLRRGAVIEGTAVDEAGRPVKGLQSSLQDLGGDLVWGFPKAPSDAEGRIQIEGVSPGREYRMKVSGSSGESGVSGPFAVADAVHPVAVRVTVLAGAAVSGRISVEGGPLPKAAWVSLDGWDFGGSPYPEDASAPVAAVKDDGTFRMEGVPPGKHYLRAAADGFLAGDCPEIEVSAGQVLEGVAVPLVPEAILQGRVVDTEGRPLAGAAVRAQWHRPDWLGGDRNPIEYSLRAQSGEDGRFAVRRLREGEYEILVRLDGWFPGYALGNAPGAEAAVVLHPTDAIAGVLLAASSGTPLPGIPVRSRQETGSLGQSHQVKGESRQDGTFLLEGLDGARPCDLLVGKEDDIDPGTRGLLPAEVQDIPVGTRDLRVMLSPGLSISGTVLDEEGRPIGGGVRVHAEREDPWGGRISTLYRHGSAGTDGAFSVEGLPKGSYRVSAWMDRTLRMDPSPDGSADFVPAEEKGVPAGSAGLEIHLRRGVYISGRVIHEEGGSPEFGWVHYGPPGTPLRDMEGHADSIDDGQFTAGPLVQGRNYDLVTRFCQGFLESRLSSVAAGSRDVVIRVKRAGRITGRVLDPEGRPAGAGVPVRAVADGADENAPGAFGWVKTGPDGAFAFEDLGPYRFRLYGGGTMALQETPDFAPVPAEAVAPGAEGVEVRTRQGVRLHGLLVDGARKAREVFYVIARQPGIPGLQEYNQREDDRTFTLIGLVPGRVVLSAETRFGEPLSLGEFDIPGDDLRVPVGGE